MEYPNIFSIASEKEFRLVSLEVFRFQFSNNPIYRRFCELLQKDPKQVDEIHKIPFIPIDFFKSERLLSSKAPVEKIFSSSGTTGKKTSKHYVTDLSLYEQSFTKAFSHFYGNIQEYAVLALLPSYLEREGSSLIYMADDLIKKSKHPKSGFYLNNLSDLKKTLISLDNSGQKVLLIGVSFALLDLVEEYKFQLQNTIIMETGGMKGRRKEMIRAELHELLMNGFGVSHIHSEYGMTELLSQAYSKGNG
ncbi:MAG: acyl transferase, partial [Gillisia sp.]